MRSGPRNRSPLTYGKRAKSWSRAWSGVCLPACRVHLKEPREPQAQVRAVLAGTLFQAAQRKLSRGSKIPVSSANRQNTVRTRNQLQVVAGVAGLFERVVQVAHEFGRLNIDRVLIFEGALLYAQDKAEPLDVVGQVGQGEKP